MMRLTKLNSELHNSIMVWNPDQPWMRPVFSDNLSSPLYYASTLGLFEVCESLIEKRENVNAQGEYGNALQAASMIVERTRGHRSIAAGERGRRQRAGRTIRERSAGGIV